MIRFALALLVASTVASAQADLAKLTVPKTHPRLGVTAEEVGRLREDVKREPWASSWKWVEERSAHVRRGQLKPENAFTGTPAGQSRRFAMTEGLECVALHALVSGDAAVAKELSDFLEAFDPSPLEKDIADNDFMSRGEFLEGLAVCLDWSWDLVSEKARANLRRIVERSAAHNHDGFVQKKSWEATTEANNHSPAAMGGVGLAAFALWHEHPDARKWAALARDKMVAYVASSFDEDGAAFEGNMYGPFGLSRILPVHDTLLRFGLADPFAPARLPSIVEQLTAELLPGRAAMVPINDTDGNFAPWPGSLYLYAARRYGSRRARWFWEVPQRKHAGGGGHGGAWALLWQTDKVEPEAPTRLAGASRGRGQVSVRSGWEANDFLAVFECGRRVAGTHGQSDVGSFLIYAKGRCLAADTGYSNEAKEGTPHQTVGHNLVLCDGPGQAITGGGAVVEGRLVQWEEKETFTWAQGDLSAAYGSKNFNAMKAATRVFVVPGGEDPYVVTIDGFVKDGKDHAWTWLLHGTADSSFTLEKDRAVHVSGDAALDIVPISLDAAAFTFEQTRFPSGNFGEHPLLRANVTGKRFLVLTVLAPRGASDNPVAVRREVKSGKLVVTVERGIRKDEFTVSAAADGRLAGVKLARSKDGKPEEQADLKLK